MLRSCKRGAAVLVVTALAAPCGCGDSDTTTFTAGSSATGTGGSGTGGTGTAGSGATMSSASGGGMGGAGPGTGGAGTMASTGTAGSGTGGSPGECMTAADCDVLFGPAPCGAWGCNAGTCEAQSPGCTDADQDGYGTGMNCTCAGLDCDDNDDTIGDTAARSCYSGPPGTAGVGTCLAGNEMCAAGVWTPCVGEVTPSGEACNNLDDNCNAMVDDNLGTFTCGIGACVATVPACTGGVVGTCTPGPGSVADGPQCDGIDSDCDGPIDEDCNNCVPVSLNGNDMTADGTFANPFRTIQAAIDWTVANNGPPTVCVAAGANCGTTGVYQNASNTTVTMADGISVLGNYEATGWTRCTGTATVTVIQPRTPEGVTFPSTITKVTVLDGFRVDRFQAMTTAAVTVNGAKNTILSGLTINNTPSVTNSYAINVINGGEATITRGRLEAGTGTGESIAVRSVGSKVTIQNNCASLNAFGRCDDHCGPPNRALTGRTTQGTGVTYGVLLQDSPGSVVETSAICGVDADQGGAIRIAGSGTGILIRGNYINAWGGSTDSHGVWMEDCGGAAPWIVDNHYINGGGDNQMSRVDGVRAIGDCHPVVDSNVQITGGGEGSASNPNGVHCGANVSNVASKCVVLGNQLIEGSDFGFPPIATGVRCDNGGCMRIAGNTITGRGGQVSYGVYLDRTGTFVDNNHIRGGCSTQATGVYANDAYARVQNNRIFGVVPGTDCPGAIPMTQSSWGMRIFAAAGVNEMDVHSNSIYGGGVNTACTSHAVEIDAIALAPPTAPVGIFRNNIMRAGPCTSARAVFVEMAPAADPRFFENNDLDSTNNPMSLYVDEGATSLTMAGSINGLMDTTVGGVISADPMYVNFPMDLHLQPASPCNGAGTSTGAPAQDMDGQPRDPATPDIGADEL